VAQADGVVANGTGAAVRADLNDQLAAVFTNHSGSSEPATTYAYQWWADTTANVLKIRNSANNDWITLRELDGTLLMEDGSAATPGLAFADDTDTGIFSGGADQVGLSTNGVERFNVGTGSVIINDPGNDVDFRVESNGQTHMLFVDGGNNRVGIGQVPTRELSLHSPDNNNSYIHFTNDDTGETASDGALVGIDGNEDLNINNQESTKNIILRTGGSERLRLDNNGRLLLGTAGGRAVGGGTQAIAQIETTSQNGLSFVAHRGTNTSGSILVLGKSRGTSVGSSTIVADDDELGALRFAGADGSDVQSRAASIAAYVDGTPGSNDMPGSLRFSTTASGASSPTERVRIDSSGNVGIGTSAPDSNRRLTVDIGTTSANVALFKSQDTSGGSYIGFMDKDTTNGNRVRVGAINDAMAFITAGSEAARLDSSGRLLVGLTSFPDSDAFVVRGGAGEDNEAFMSLVRGSAPANNQNLGVLRFHGNGNQTEAARITALRDGGTWTAGSSHPGRLAFSTTADGASSPTERMRIGQSGQISTIYSSGIGIRIGSTASAGSNNLIQGGHSASNISNMSTSFIVSNNGNVTNTNNSYGAISDAKLKENIVDASSQWDNIKDLRVRNYNFIEGQTHTQIGVVAQEVETVSPGLVSESPDRDEEGNDLGTVTKSVNYSVLYMKAVKALQEAMDRIETLEAKVAALEAG
jgi:hypothetical protein